MDLIFRRAVRSEREAVAQVLRDAFTAYVRKLGRELSDPYEWLESAILVGGVYVAVEGDRIVGAVVAERGETGLYIRMLAVTPERQRSGIGGWLLERCEDTAQAEGLAALSLHTAEIMDGHLRFYHRHGFEEVRRALPDHGRDRHLRVHLEKRL